MASENVQEADERWSRGVDEPDNDEDNAPERASEDRALEAAAVDIVMRLGAAAREGLNMPGTDQVLDIMRRHGLRGPEPEGSVGSLNEFKRAYLPETAKREEEERARTTTEGEP